MKATKKIVGAACALVAAVALSAGSTFAWFSSNGQVKATGLTVDVKTDNAYLVISDEVSTLSQGAKELDLTTLGTKDDETIKLSPSAYKKTTVGTTDYGLADDDIVWSKDKTAEKGILNPKNWFTGNGASATDGTLTSSVKTLDAVNFEAANEYVVTANMYISVLGTTPVKSVQVTMDKTFLDTDKNNDAITILFLYRFVDIETDGVKEADTPVAWKHTEVTCASDSKLEGFELLGSSEELNAETAIQVKVLVYFDGNSNVVTTSNQANLTGATFNFTFKGPDAPAEEDNG